MATSFSMKSVITGRVDPLAAERLFGASRQLGPAQTCPVDAMAPDVDVLGRPQGGARHRLMELRDPACSQFVYSVDRRIKHENAERPMLGPAESDFTRNTGDLMYGSARDHFPQGIYGEGPFNTRGNFESLYKPNIRPNDGVPSYTQQYMYNSTQLNRMGHNAMNKPFGG